MANIVSFASMPLLARVYGSEPFGIFAVYFAISNLIGTPSNLRFELAIPIAKNESEAAAVSTLALLLTLAISLLFAIVFFFEWPRHFFVVIPSGYSVWCLTAVSVLLLGLTQIFVQRCIRLGRLRSMSLRPIVERVGFVLFAIGAFNFNFEATGLIWAQTLALAVSLLTIVMGAMWTPQRAGIKEVFRKFSDFPRKNLPSTFLQQASAQLPMLVFARFFSPQELGYLSMAQRLTDAPVSLLSGSVSVVYYRRILQAARESYRSIFMRTLILGALTLGVPCLLAGIFADPILDFLFGPKWEPSHIFFVLLLPMAFFKMLYWVHNSYFFVLRRLGPELVLSIALLSVQVIGVALGLTVWHSLSAVIALTANAMAVVYFAGLIALYRITKA